MMIVYSFQKKSLTDTKQSPHWVVNQFEIGVLQSFQNTVREFIGMGRNGSPTGNPPFNLYNGKIICNRVYGSLAKGEFAVFSLGMGSCQKAYEHRNQSFHLEATRKIRVR